MNDELKKRLVGYLDVMEDAGQKGAEFVAGQAPETIRQFIAWEIACNAILAVMWFSLFLGCAYAARRLWKFIASDENNRGIAFILLPPIAGMVGTFIGFATCFVAAAKVWVAPNVFLIEKAAELFRHT